MEIADAQKLINDLVKKKSKHQDYDVVTNLARKLQMLMTGKNSALWLRRMVNRETAEAFTQRIALTSSITPAIAASIRVPFYKVARNQRIKTNIDVKDEAKNEQIKLMAKNFYGSGGRKTKGLDYWLKTRFMDLTFIDPNAWVAIEWDAPQSSADTITSRPFEISSAEAWDFKVINEKVFWLFCCFAYNYNTVQSGQTDPVKKSGLKYTLYEIDNTITYEQVEEAYLKQIGYVLKPNQRIVSYDNDKTVTFLETVNQPKLGFTPTFRIGYNRDLDTKSRTYVNPFQDGMCYFDKCLKSNSEFDLTMALHAFPQKIQYAPKCVGITGKSGGTRKPCNGGYFPDGSVCTICNGTGFSGHTSAQDVLNLPLPEKGTPNNEVIELSKLIAYITPTIELLNFQNNYLDKLQTAVHSAVFNSQVFVRKSGGGGGNSSQKSSDGAPIQTATENDNNMQSVYDALEPFTEKFSDLWEDIITVFAIQSNIADIEEVDIDHVFPADFKLKTTDILLGELRTVSDSGAPSFMKDVINNDLAEIIFAGDSLGLLKYRVKRKFFPFNGKGPDEIALLLSSADVPRRSKILYSNFELIFSDIEQETPNFWTMATTAAQLVVLNTKIDQYKETITADAPVLDINSLRTQMTAIPNGPNPAAGGGAGK